MSAKKAIEIAKKTGNLTAAVTEALSKSRAFDLHEDMGAKSQKQVWWVPNQDALNQLTMRIEDKLPSATYTVADASTGAKTGFEITVSGEFDDNDVASLAAVKGAQRIDGPNSDLG